MQDFPSKAHYCYKSHIFQMTTPHSIDNLPPYCPRPPPPPHPPHHFYKEILSLLSMIFQKSQPVHTNPTQIRVCYTIAPLKLVFKNRKKLNNSGTGDRIKLKSVIRDF